MKNLEIGDPVIWVDSKGRDHNALVTAIWSATCINVVFVSSDENRKDDCGRQIERQTSATHMSVQGVHGFYWRLPTEEKAGYVPPQKV